MAPPLWLCLVKSSCFQLVFSTAAQKKSSACLCLCAKLPRLWRPGRIVAFRLRPNQLEPSPGQLTEETRSRRVMGEALKCSVQVHSLRLNRVNDFRCTTATTARRDECSCLFMATVMNMQSNGGNALHPFFTRPNGMFALSS